MIRKIIILFILLSGLSITIFGQTSDSGQNYNSFSSRNFMKFNRFLTVPTFSALRENKTSLTAIVRNSNVDFEDNPRLHLVSYAGKMRENVGAGFAVYQQEVGAMKDFGAIANYAQRLQLSGSMDLTFGFNFLYSRSSIDWARVLVQDADDSFLGNFQDIPIVMLQPAVTLSFGKFDVGLFFENLIDFNLKSSKMATSFGEKTFSAHAMYSREFTYASGIFEGADLRTLVIARKPGKEEFSVGGSVILDLPKAGWAKVGYDKTYGISAGVGVNISEKLAIGFSYEKSKFAATNEIGLIYNFGKKSFRRERPKRRTGKVSVVLPERISEKKEEYDNPEHNDLSDEIQTAQDSIDILNKKVDEILRLLKNQPPPKIVKTNTSVVPDSQVEGKDNSLRRRSNKPWRESTITYSGGGGTMYYIVADKFRDKENAEVLIAKWKRLKVEAKYIYQPEGKWYYVYIDRFAKEEDAEEKIDEFNDKTRLYENNDKNDESSIKIKKGGKDPVYIEKLTIGSSGDSYKEPKKQGPARVRTMSNIQGVIPGYYIQIYVNSKKSLADRNVDELVNDGIEAGYFVNPKTGYMHVYIAKTDSREEAIRLYNNNLNGSYYDIKTIVHIK
ncbi:PorP/SprF family type IX secretion system membrane protein [Tenacibaculum ovolyticum]|uniref:PorP/SprF family type IX secretion system membrane protein n=1 Tax=Tenacibaculum ovolyticum TaxID=104270 RepID=UPI003BA8FC04